MIHLTLDHYTRILLHHNGLKAYHHYEYSKNLFVCGAFAHSV